MSRFTGAWIGIKCVKETIESTASIDARLDRVRPLLPTDFAMPLGGLNIRSNDPVLVQEMRLQTQKRDAMLAFLRVNRLNRIVISGGGTPRLGIITTGKSYLDVRQALDELGIDELRANEYGLRLYKIACPWPLEPDGLREFARGLEKIIVVEEKRSLIETQLREELYGSKEQPVCIGKKDEKGQWLFPVTGALDPNDIAIAIGRRLLEYVGSEALQRRIERLERAQEILVGTTDVAARTSYFCSGCPHNSSTKVPEGMRAYAGIGCHYMVQKMDRATEGYTQMGGEGANWIGEAPFSTRQHIIQNLGDGTYNHSGILALRWAADTGVNITFKILFNDAVAMTGGQSHEGNLTVDMIARQVAAERVQKIVLVTDEPDKYSAYIDWPAGLTIKHRDELDEIQRELAEIRGTTVLIYDQTCAAEKRRRRKRGLYPDPDKRVFINARVCEGCGDCGKASNCVSVQPVETEYGRKRAIDQSSCNKDFSCLDGFCPAFVTLHGAAPKGVDAEIEIGGYFPPLPEPVLPALGEQPFSILVAGVGGTGVVTIGSLLGMAAHIEGKGCGSVDMAGLAQKGGTVYSHVKIAAKPEDIHAISISAGGADLVLGCDLVVSGTAKVLASIRSGESGVIVNTAEVYSGDFTRNADFSLPSDRIVETIRHASGGAAAFCDAMEIATVLLGSSLGTNMLLLGYAWQRGFVPLSDASLFAAITVNGEAIEMNKRAFTWGRRAAFAPERVAAILARAKKPTEDRRMSKSLAEIVERRSADLTAYQNVAYAEKYRQRIAKIEALERAKMHGQTALAEAAARNLFKLMAAKDEFEVARLYSDGSFAAEIAANFEGAARMEFHLAPPILGRTNGRGEPKKMSFGPWMMPVFKGLAAAKILRGTIFDIFGRTPERRLERQLRADYEALLDEIVAGLTPDNHALAVALASIPDKIRGFGHVKQQHIATAKAEEKALLAQFRNAPENVRLAAE
jgi:indolepyruvate ferredoxin oxidoreductase